MIATLIRQDPSFRRLPFWVLMAMVWAGAATGMIAWITARRGPVGLDWLAVVIWLAVTLYLVAGESGSRANRFNLSLPISARELWVAHVIAVGLTGVAVLAISTVVTTGSLVLIGKLIEGWGVDGGALAVLISLLGAALVLSVAIVHAFRPEAQEVPLSLRRVGWSLVAAAVPLALVLILRPLGILGVVIVLGLAVATFGRVSRTIPRTFSVPVQGGRAGVPVKAAPGEVVPWEATQRPVGLWFSMRIAHGVSTCAKKPFAVWLILPFLLFLGFVVSGIDRFWSESSQRFALPFMIVYVMMALTTMTIAGIGVIDYLPWSRRRTLALITVPLFLTVVAGYGIGRVTDALLGNNGEALCFVKDRQTGSPRLCVLLGECQVAWSGHVPEITTPSGETHTPWNKPVVKGLPFRVYFPYDVPAGSSTDFAAMQISRAAGALFGADIPPDEIRSRYLEAVAPGDMPALTIQADYPELRRVDRGVYFPWIMAAVVLVWSLLTAGYIHWLRAGVPPKRQKTVGWILIAVPMLFWILDFVLEVTRVSEIDMRNALIIHLAKRVGETWVGTAAVWVGSALVAWAAYRLVERRFERAELSMKPLGGHS